MAIHFDFENKFALVTGGARGIGLEIASEFLAGGATVAIWDYAEEAIATSTRTLSEYGSRVHFQQVDVTNVESCAAAAEALPFRLDILVNNAGITRDKSFAKMTSDDFAAVVDTNLGGVFNVTKSLLDKFHPTSTDKRIINISSLVALHGNFGQANYAAAKAGIIGFSKTLARELGRKGFTVNAVAPGFIQTAMVEAMPAEVRSTIEAKVPVGRMGTPRDIAQTCLFLASDSASYINGTVVSVDGGLVI